MAQVQEVSDFESLKKSIMDRDLVCLHIFAEWAPECAELTKILELLTSEFKDITFISANAENVEDFCVEKNVSSVPTVLFYKFGDLYGTVEGFDVPGVKNQCKKLSNFVGLRPIKTGSEKANGAASGDQNGASTQEAFNEYLGKLINRAPMMVFMKGSPSEPKCGFSRQTMELLSNYKNVKFDYYDILQNDKVRQGLKTYSNWQTYPQVYVDGELIGGIDILRVRKVIESSF